MSISELEIERKSLSAGNRRFVVLPADQLPEEALTWQSAKERTYKLRQFRRAMMHRFGNQGRVMRLAWLLCELCSRNGYAYASDHYLEKETGLTRNKLAATLTQLARVGAIVRVHRKTDDGKTARHIFVGRKPIEGYPPKWGVRVPPKTVSPKTGGQTLKRKQRWAPRTQQDLASAAAALRDDPRLSARATPEAATVTLSSRTRPALTPAHDATVASPGTTLTADIARRYAITRVDPEGEEPLRASR